MSKLFPKCGKDLYSQRELDQVGTKSMDWCGAFAKTGWPGSSGVRDERALSPIATESWRWTRTTQSSRFPNNGEFSTHFCLLRLLALYQNHEKFQHSFAIEKKTGLNKTSHYLPNI